MSNTTEQDIISAPLIIAPTYGFDGDDGSWSTFSIEIGTPRQSFRVLPSILGQEIDIPIPQGCLGILSNVGDCGDLRGANSFNGSPSRGFNGSASETWNQTGIFPLPAEEYLYGPEDTGLFGLETISLSKLPNTAASISLEGQIVAGVATGNAWLGRIGLGVRPTSFNQGTSTPSLLVALKEQNLTTSLSYGYTAGQSYASPPVPGSLVLGGFDQSRLSSAAVSLPINATTNAQPFSVSIQNVVASQTLTGSIQTLQLNAITANLDSATSQLWLPRETCDLFEAAFGLSYDSETDLYLVNDTIHSQLKEIDPYVTFTIGDGQAVSTNVVLHYNAFDLNASIPVYNTSTPYFPIRRAANATQYVLGRTFLQEAYVVVDWERLNFTIGSTIPQNKTTDIVPIMPFLPSSSEPAAPSTTASAPTPHKKSNTGTIAGAVVAVVAILAIVVGIIYCLRLRRRRRQATHTYEATAAADPIQSHGNVEYFPPEKHDSLGHKSGSDVSIAEMSRVGAMSPSAFSEMDSGQYRHRSKLSELGSTDIHEMADAGRNRELEGTPVYELEGDRIGSELSSSHSPVDNRDYFGPVVVRDDMAEAGPAAEGGAAGEAVRSVDVSPLNEDGTRRSLAVSPLSENGTRRENVVDAKVSEATAGSHRPSLERRPVSN